MQDCIDNIKLICIWQLFFFKFVNKTVSSSKVTRIPKIIRLTYKHRLAAFLLSLTLNSRAPCTDR